MSTDSINMPGPRKLTDEIILNKLQQNEPPVWSARRLSEETGVVRQTAHERLKEIAERHESIKTMQVDRATVYYFESVSGDPSAPIEQRHKELIIKEFSDKFAGLRTAPWTAIHPNDGPAEAGDKIQIEISGTPGNWSEIMRHKWENRREEFLHECGENETQATISATLYSKATVPIEHINYPDDWNIELNIGGEYHDVKGQNRQILIVPGVKNHLVKPCNDAVFLKDVSVDWISPGHGDTEKQVTEITEEMLEEVAEWREEHLDGDNGVDS